MTPWWDDDVLEVWVENYGQYSGAMDMNFAQAVARERARRTGRRQRVEVNNRGQVFAGWRLAIVEAGEAGT